jgi:hypothetical protein
VGGGDFVYSGAGYPAQLRISPPAAATVVVQPHPDTSRALQATTTATRGLVAPKLDMNPQSSMTREGQRRTGDRSASGEFENPADCQSQTGGCWRETQYGLAWPCCTSSSIPTANATRATPAKIRLIVLLLI